MTTTLERPLSLGNPDGPVGKVEPRLWTRPLRDLTPETTLGYEACAFAEQVLGVDLLPWQRWWLLHALELREDGTFRFSTVLTLVSRQNGKTVLLKIVALWALYMGRVRLVLGAAQALNIARESWQAAVSLADSVPDLRSEVASVRYTNGEQCLTLTSGARYMITAATRGAGRGLSVDLLILDELREQRSTEAWAALGNTTMARPNALTVGISNQGDDQSIVLNTLRSSALAGTDPKVGLFEWSAPDGCELDDLDGLLQANPGVPYTVTLEKLATMRATTSPVDFRTENLCQRVDTLDAAIDPQSWSATADPSLTLAPWRPRLVACVDVAPDGRHVTLAAAAVGDDGIARGEILDAWPDTDVARVELPALFERLRPRAVGWFPSGPAAVLGADLEKLHGVTLGKWDQLHDEMLDHSPGLVPLQGAQVTAACQLLADLVLTRKYRHSDDPLLNAHVAGAQRLAQGDGWRFARRGVGHVDATYAMAGAVSLARELPPPVPTTRPAVF
jgi:hypothetical protein